MKSLGKIWCLYATVIVFVAVGEALGQIDHRVNRGNTATGGRALDKNPSMDGSRFNLTRPGLNTPGAMSNAIITGNVTGLAGFKGESPVLQANQFRDSMPSSDLSGFQARSVGLQEITSGRNTLSPTFYYGTQETLPNAGQITQGLNAPGTSKLITTHLPPPEVEGQNNSSKELNALIRPVEDRRVGIVPVVPKAGVSQQLITTDEGTSGAPASPYGSAIGSSIFGTPPPAATTPEARRPLVGEVNLPWETRTGVTEEGEPIETLDSADVNPPLQDKTEPSSIQEKPGEQSPGTDGPPPGPIPTPENLGHDRFADLYSAVELAQRFGARNMGFNIGPSTAANATEGTSTRPPGLRDLVRRPSEGMMQLATAAKWAKDVVEDPLRSFAGKYQDRLNQYMAAGEADLRAGRYYAAAGHFDLAATVDPLNPLPLLARGHAYVAAGDYLSAVHSIEEGIRRFPQIAAFRIDLPGIVGQHDIFDIRRADLESKLATAENAEFRFLLGYIELYSGLPEEGLKNLERAAKDAPPASMIAIFADLVSGRRELPAVGR